MTRGEILNFKIGSELDYLVREKIFNENEVYLYRHSSDPYSTNMEYAWKVFNHIMDNNFFSKRQRFFKELQYLTVVFNPTDQVKIVAYPDVFAVLRNRFPEAICKAGLLMLVNN